MTIHHEDCDYRNSLAAKEAAEIYGVDIDEHSEVFGCNLDCENMESILHPDGSDCDYCTYTEKCVTISGMVPRGMVPDNR